MPFTHLFLRDIGPFRDLHLDLTDGQGKPHLGPHILAGVNGSGKSTLLRSLALSAIVGARFESRNIKEFVQHWFWSSDSTVLSERFVDNQSRGFFASKQDPGETSTFEIPAHWSDHAAISRLITDPESRRHLFSDGLVEGMRMIKGPYPEVWREVGSGSHALFDEFVAAYRPALPLRCLDGTPPAYREESSADWGALGFETTIDNEQVQYWLLDQFSKRAIASTKGGDFDRFSAALQSADNLLSSIFGQRVHLDVDIEAPISQIRFVFAGHSLNFSQLPDGVRYLLGMTVDFLRRRDLLRWREPAKESKPSVLLIDEIDGHLHPKWQRQVLPALKAAFPDVQIIVSTHSPFVISSCDRAVVHVLELAEDGVATARPPMQAPVGMSLEATIKDVFGVESRFGVQTERDLAEWNALQKRSEAGPLSDRETVELKRLSADLASRGEELRLIVESAGTLSKKALQALLNS